MFRLVLTLLALLLPPSLVARTLERGNGPEPDSLDPQRGQGLSAQQILRDLFEGLVREDAHGQTVAGAAQRWEISADGLGYRFWLRPDARFADGQPLTAEDFVYSLKRALDPATAAPYAAALFPIVGAQERLRGESQPALGVEALAPDLLQIRLKQPRSDFLRRLTLPLAMPVQAAAVRAHGGAFTRPGRLYGNGAYLLHAWTPQAAIELVRNPHYHGRDSVQIERVRFHVTEDASQELKRFLAGELHLTETLPPGQLQRLQAEHGDALHLAPAYASFFLGYNLRHPLLANSELREALSLAIDRDVLVRHIVGNGESPAYGIVPALTAAHAPVELEWAAWTKEQRLQRAQTLYAQAGYSREQPLRIELRYNTSLQNRRLALAIAAMWDEHLGVRTRLRNEEWRVFVQNRRAGVLTQVFRAGWFADYADPLNFLEPFTSGHALNAVGYDDPRFDQLLATAAASMGEARDRALLQAEQRLLAAHALIPLFRYTSKHLVSPELCGFKAHPLDQHPSQFLYFCEDPAP